MIYLVIAGLAGILIYKNRVATTPQQATAAATQSFIGTAALPAAGPGIQAVQYQVEPAVVAIQTAGTPVVAPTMTPPELVQLGPILREPAIQPPSAISPLMVAKLNPNVSLEGVGGLGGSYGALL